MNRIIYGIIILCSLSLSAQEKSFEELKKEGMEFYDSGDFKKAVQAFSTAIEMKNDDLEIYEKRGIAYKWLAQAELAFDDLSKAIESEPTAALYANRADVRTYEDIKGRINDLEQAVKLDKDQFDYVYNLAIAKFEIITNHQVEQPTASFIKKDLEKLFGFEMDICDKMQEAAKLNNSFSSKADEYCDAINGIIQTDQN